MGFLLCGECARHIKSSEASCPFCGAAASAQPTSQPRPAAMSRTRAAFFFGAAAISGTLAAAGCSSSSSGTYDNTSCCPPYGHPIVDSGPAPDTGTAEDAGPETEASTTDASTDASDAAD